MVSAGLVRECLLIGFGSTLRGDDGLGPRIVEEMRGALPVVDGCRVSTLVMPQLDIAMVSLLSDADVVVFVDARADDNEEPVSVRRIEPEPGPPSLTHTSHSIAAPALLSMARDWYGSAPECYMVAPKGYEFRIAETLSEGAQHAAVRAKERIIEILKAQISD